jgi:3-methylfumaryl-CoA hydratase
VAWTSRFDALGCGEYLLDVPLHQDSTQGAAVATEGIATIERLKDWIGLSEERTEQLTYGPSRALAAALDRHEPTSVGDPLPPLRHWLHFLPYGRPGELRPDGSPRTGSLLPPVPLPRRMWAGSRVAFAAPLRVGQVVTRRTTIADVEVKVGRSGPLVFVRVVHELGAGEGCAIREEQDVVFRSGPRPGESVGTAAEAPADPEWVRTIAPDEVLLFRYSALSFNSHRIHFDRPYATRVEGYPGLVVHGPLTATLLLDHLRDRVPGAHIDSFEFRAIRPIFCDGTFAVCAELAPDRPNARLWARDQFGAICMTGEAVLS